MKVSLSSKWLLFANKVAKIPFAKKVLKPIYYPYKRRIEKHRNKVFKENGIKVIADFDSCCRENNLSYYLAFGSMLGAVREHGFIKHDLDLDVFMWAKDYSNGLKNILEGYGFKLKHSFLVDNGNLGREDTYSKYGVSIDIFYIYPAIDSYPYTCDFRAFPGFVTWSNSQERAGGVQARRIEIPVSVESVQVDFEGVKVNIPENYDEFLRFRYGDDYMIPNPRWHNGENPHIVVWNNQKAEYKSYH